MDINLTERNLAHKMHSHHHHPCDPEKDNIKGRHQNVTGIIFIKLRRLIRPAKRGERPECRAKPRIKNIGITGENNILPVRFPRLFQRIRLAFRNIDFSIRAIPCGNLVSPPELAGNAPGLDIFHPVEIGVFPLFGNKFRFA